MPDRKGSEAGQDMNYYWNYAGSVWQSHINWAQQCKSYCMVRRRITHINYARRSCDTEQQHLRYVSCDLLVVPRFKHGSSWCLGCPDDSSGQPRHHYVTTWNLNRDDLRDPDVSTEHDSFRHA